MNITPLNFNFGNSLDINSINGMPNMRETLECWVSTITLIKITQSQVDYDKSITEEEITFSGVIQPLKPEDIQYVEDGQRSWEWLQIHSYSGDLNLTTDDRIQIDGIIYKVMGVYNYSRNGYIEYHIVKDYQ